MVAWIQLHPWLSLGIVIAVLSIRQLIALAMLVIVGGIGIIGSICLGLGLVLSHEPKLAKALMFAVATALIFIAMSFVSP